MSIPGLGQLASTQLLPSATRTITLQPLWEWRFEVAHGTEPITVRLLTGTAERDGTELAPNQPYVLSGTKSKILTWHGCTLEVDGPCDEYVAETNNPSDSPAVQHLNLHLALQALRDDASRSSPKKAGGPRVMVCGPPGSGKSTVARTLVALAAKMGAQPMLVSVDPRDGMLSLPGTISAAVFASLMDVESPEGGIGVRSTPSSGPSAIPVKLPLVYYFGRDRPEEDPDLWRELVTDLGKAATGRVQADEMVREAGMVIDVPAVAMGQAGTELLAHVVKEFGVDIVVVLGSPLMSADLQKRFAQEKSRIGEPIIVVSLDKSSGVVDRGAHFMQLSREASIKEYFFGDTKRTLSPYTQNVGFDEVLIYTAPEESDYPETQKLLPVDPSIDMSNCTLALMNASPNDAPDSVRRAPVMGFVYIADVDSDRRRLKVLAPISGRLGDRPMIWGRWPEPYISLLG